MSARSAPLSIDGLAVSNSQRATAVITDPNVLFEFSELQRKLERREMEIKRKDKDIIALQKEIARYQKDMKGSTNEISLIRERNEQLQTSLMNSRLLSQDARNDAEQRQTNMRIKELESAVASGVHRSNIMQGEIDANLLKYRTLENENMNLTAQLEIANAELTATKQENYTQGLKLKTLNMRLEDKSKEYEELRDQMLLEKKDNMDSKGGMARFKAIIEEKNKEIKTLESDVKKLQETLHVRTESNVVLREQMEDIHGSKHVLNKDEMKRFKAIEQENEALTTRLKSMTKSVDLHMELLRRAETDSTTLRHSLEEATMANKKLQKDYDRFSKEKGIDAVSLANIRKDVIALRRENKEYAEKLRQLQTQNANSGVAEKEVMQIKQGIVSLARDKQEEIEAKKDEKKRRVVAEESMKALRNRISYLMSQLNHISQSAIDWQSEKVVLHSQITSLHNTNIELRTKLVHIQRSFMTRHLEDMNVHARIGNSKASFMSEYAGPATGDGTGVDTYRKGQDVDPIDVLMVNPHRKSALEITDLGGVFQDEAARPMPSSTEGLMERVLFDTTCAFLTGVRTPAEASAHGAQAKKKKALRQTVKPFKTRMSEDGLVEIYLHDSVDTNNGLNSAVNSDELEAIEMLSSLQINSFLKFVQGRPSSKVPILCTEKIASLLNYMRLVVAEAVDNCSEARIAQSKLTSRMLVTKQRNDRIRIRYFVERVAKQKNILKFIRENMKLSDLQITLDAICQKGADKLEELRLEAELSAGTQLQASKSSMTSLAGRGSGSGWNHGSGGGGSNINNSSGHGGGSSGSGGALDIASSNMLSDFLEQLMAIAQELMSSSILNTTAGGQPEDATKGSGVRVNPPGSMEIRLPESAIDDETLHSIIGLLCGVLMSSGGTVGGSGEGGNDDAQDSEYNRAARETGQGPANSFANVHSTSRLSRTILATSCDYTNRILLLNLRDNMLTDLSCQLLGSFVEKSTELRMLDLRGNMISVTGLKQLFDATRRNPSVLYVTQRQEGCMIEGHRELIDGQGSDRNDQQTTFTRLVGAPKYALRIDLRNNNASSEKLLEALDILETVGGKENEFTAGENGVDSATGKYKDFSGLDVSVNVPSYAHTLNMSKSGGYIPADGNMSNVWGMGGIAGASGQSFMMGQGLTSNYNRSGVGAAGQGALEEDHNIIDDIVKSPGHSGVVVDSAGTRSTNGVAGVNGQYQPVGSFIDEKIRQMQQSKTSGGTRHRAEEFKPIDMTARQRQTRAVYNNKVSEYESSSHHLLEKKNTGGAGAGAGPNTPLAKLHKTMPTQHATSDPILNSIFARDDSGMGMETAKSPGGAGARKKAQQQRPKSAGGAGRAKKSGKLSNYNQFNPATLF